MQNSKPKPIQSSFIENQDLLLSCTLTDPNDFISDENTFNLSNKTSIDLTEPSINPSSFVTCEQTLDQNEQKEIKDEIMDFNIFELLQAEDPEMARLLESVETNNSISYLPQISINSTNKILNDSVESKSDLDSHASAINLLVNPNESDSFNELSDLFLNSNNNSSLASSLNKQTVINNNNFKNIQLTTVPSRVSMRLIKKKENFTPELINDENKRSRSVKNSSKKQSGRIIKRKRSIEDDEEDIKVSKRSLIESNENSLDLDSTNDHIFYNDEDSFSLSSYDSKSDFKSYKSNFNNSNRSSSKDLDPIKKESNKEAATRYRIKKSNEKEILFETRINLEKENDQIKKRIELVQTEINYLKNMLVQTLLTKGLLNNTGSELF